ncbi:MAG: SurA N-terminal domain-containing protein [Betaproteobacteria bacterium]|nr:SurA N-terminal domain-containing protein [Betaproteobacteria bacterium]
MFDAVRNNQRIVQLFLALITLPFAFWGVDSYVRNASVGADFASVGDTKISAQQFDKAFREQQDRMRQQLGTNFRPETMNTPEARLALLNSLVDQRLLLLEAAKGRLGASDDLLREIIGKIPALQENGQFSMARYQNALAAQGMTQPQFESQLRQDLTMQQLVGALGDTGIVSNTAAEAMLRIQAEERQVAELRIAPEQFADQLRIDAAAAQKHYDENIKQFELPEQAKAEYVVLSLETLLAQTTVGEAEVKAWYDSHQERYQQAEERRASHILLMTNASAPEAEKAKAKAKAEEVLKEIERAPGKFAELAKKVSQDPGSAEKGGDLGFFGRGMMVKAFEDTVFKQKEGEVSGLVQSEFGYHIIKLTGIKGGKQRSMEEARPEIEGELKRQAASRKFAESAEAFSNMVYEQSDSLNPVAEKFKLKIQQSNWLPRTTNPQIVAALGTLGNAKVLASLFSDDAVKNKRNTEAVEVAPNTLLAARVLEHRPAAAKPFESVKADIEARLKAQQAAVLVKQAGEAQLATLQAGEDKANWALVKNVSRLQGRQVPPAAMQAIFKAGVQKLPAYVGVDVGGNYMLYKIMKVSQPEKTDDNQRKVLQREYSTMAAQEDFGAYLAALRARYKIEINKSALETKERQ